MMTSINLRPELAQHLAQRLQAFTEGFRQNLALIGPPGSGKTFQLQQLAQARGRDVLFVHCPLYRESCRSFLQRLLLALLQVGLRAKRAPLASSSSILAQAAVLLPKTAAAAQAVEPLLSRRLYGEAFNRTLDLIPVVANECGQSCVLVLDEFLFLEDMGLGHAFHEVGKRVMTWPSVLFILASSSPFRARTILRERLQLLFGQFELLTLGAFHPDAACALIEEQWSKLRGVDAVAPFLTEWVGGYPSYLTVLLNRLRELAALEHQNAVTEALFVRTVWDVLGRREGVLHQWCAARVDALAHGRHGGRAVEALIHVARGVRTATALGSRIGRAGIAEALQRLVEHDLAQRNGTCWMVSDPVLRCWLSTVLSAQRSGAEPAESDVREAMDEYLRSLWLRWMDARELSFPEQVAALFARFEDDLVCLDAKTGKLPRFSRITVPRETAPNSTYLIADDQGRRWCANIQESAIDEQSIARFESFCQSQLPKPSRKIVIAKSGMDEHARVLAKTANMWVWQGEELEVLGRLYGNRQSQA